MVLADFTGAWDIINAAIINGPVQSMAQLWLRGMVLINVKC